MKNLVLVGLNHKTAPVEIRERLTFPSQFLRDALHRLVDRTCLEEGLIVSTCNRVEVVAKATDQTSEPEHIIANFLQNYHKLPVHHLRPHLYTYRGSDAVRHVFRVASSLDSMVIGESQILGQVKTAYEQAIEVGTVGHILHRLLSRAFSVAKRVRTETTIAEHAVSVSSIAVEVAKKIFDNLAGKTALLIGAGEMSELAAQHLLNAGIQTLLIANRTPENAHQMARRFGRGQIIELKDIATYLPKADIVIASTTAPSYIVDRTMAHQALIKRRNRPLLLIDLSVPRNIDPTIAEIENLFVFDIDDLENAVKANLRERLSEAKRAEAIIEVETQDFLTQIDQISIGPTVAALKTRLHTMTQTEFDRHRKHLGTLTPEQEHAIRTLLLGSVVNKVLHPIIVGLREASRTKNGNSIDILRAFELDDTDHDQS